MSAADVANPPQGDLTLYTLGGAFGMRNVSPFCLKLEMLMTALDLPFELKVEPDPRKAPKGKLPFATFGDEVIADSELIVARLDEMTNGGVFARIDPRDRAHGLGLTRLAEEHLYWMMVASRWLDDAWWPNVVEGFFHIVPKPFRNLAAGMARKQVKKTYELQGLGLHSAEEQRGFAHRDLAALTDAVGPDGFLFGATPTVYDFSIAAVMAGIYDHEPRSWLTDLAEDYPDLKAFTQRTQEYVQVFGK